MTAEHTRNEHALLNDRQLAAKLQISRGMVHKLDSAGKLPQSVRLGRCKRWRTEEIESWLAAGAPGRAEWQLKQGQA